MKTPFNNNCVAASITGYKKKKSLFWNKFLWFIYGFVCGLIIFGIL